MYRRVSWNDLKPGDKVYEKGVMDGALRYYGPYTVASQEDRRLTNKAGRSFMCYPDDLYMKES